MCAGGLSVLFVTVDVEKTLADTYSGSVSSPVLSLELQGSEVMWESGLGSLLASLSPRSWTDLRWEMCVCEGQNEFTNLPLRILYDPVDIKGNGVSQTSSS